MTSECEAGVRDLPDLVLDIDKIEDENLTDTNKDSPPSVVPACSSGATTLQVKSEIPVSQSPSQRSSGNDKKTLSSHGEDQKGNKTDSRFTPKQVQNSRLNGKVGPSKLKTVAQPCGRPCQQHSFLTDITDVRQMEKGLFQLLDDFHLGKLQAFGKDCTFEKMENVREQQERLARLHFDLNAQQEIYGPQSEDGRRMARENLSKLIENLQQLSQSIEQLQSASPSVQTDV